MATEYLTRDEIVDEFEFVEDVDLKRGIDLQGEDEGVRTKKGIVREYATEDQVKVNGDVRAKSNESYQALLMIQRLYYAEVEDRRYRRLTMKEAMKIRGSDQNAIGRAIRELSGDVENFLPN